MSASTDLPTPPPAPLRSWLAVLAAALATFSVVTTEMLPVGLLTAISSTLDVSAGTAGLTMTAPGIVAAVAAPALTVLTGRFDRRRVLAALAGLLALANLLSALAPDIVVLLASRVLLGVAIGGVWAIAAGLAGRLVPVRSAPAATALVFSGISVASVLGVPTGTVLGELGGWRSAFFVMAAVSVGLVVALAVLLPPLPPTPAGERTGAAQLLRNPRLRAGLVVTLLLVTGHFAAYTYVRPVLEQLAGADAGLVGTLLLVYGIAGVAGNFAAGAVAPRHLHRTVLVIAGLVVLSVLLVPVVGPQRIGVVAVLVAWGVGYGGVSVSLQTWMLRSAPHAPEPASALLASVFNVAIALGALLGGRTIDALGTTGVLWLGAFAVALAMAVVLADGIAGRRSVAARRSVDPLLLRPAG